MLNPNILRLLLSVLLLPSSILVYSTEVNKNFAHLDQAMREKLIQQNIIQKDADAEDEHLAWFSAYDRDENLKLDGHEVMFGILQEDIVQEEVKGEFFDFSKSEFYDDPKALYAQVDNVMDVFDLNGDGFVTFSEYKVGMESDINKA